jgi:hypothetical protein
MTRVCRLSFFGGWGGGFFCRTFQIHMLFYIRRLYYKFVRRKQLFKAKCSQHVALVPILHKALQAVHTAQLFCLTLSMHNDYFLNNINSLIFALEVQCGVLCSLNWKFRFFTHLSNEFQAIRFISGETTFARKANA